MQHRPRPAPFLTPTVSTAPQWRDCFSRKVAMLFSNLPGGSWFSGGWHRRLDSCCTKLDSLVQLIAEYVQWSCVAVAQANLLARKALGAKKRGLSDMRNDGRSPRHASGQLSRRRLSVVKASPARARSPRPLGVHAAAPCLYASPTRTVAGPARARPCATRPAGVRGWVHDFTEWHTSLCFCATRGAR